MFYSVKIINKSWFTQLKNLKLIAIMHFKK